jgi:hypothetical protein
MVKRGQGPSARAFPFEAWEYRIDALSSQGREWLGLPLVDLSAGATHAQFTGEVSLKAQSNDKANVQRTTRAERRERRDGKKLIKCQVSSDIRPAHQELRRQSAAWFMVLF